MKSIIVNHTVLATFLFSGLLTSPLLAASHGAKDAGVDNIFNYILGAGSIAVIAVGIWVLYSNMKR